MSPRGEDLCRFFILTLHIEFLKGRRSLFSFADLLPRLELSLQYGQDIDGLFVRLRIYHNLLHAFEQVTRRVGKQMRRPATKRLSQLNHEQVEVGATEI